MRRDGNGQCLVQEAIPGIHGEVRVLVLYDYVSSCYKHGEPIWYKHKSIGRAALSVPLLYPDNPYPLN